MNTARYFTIAIVTLLSANCSAAPKTATENANIAWQNSSEIQTTNAPAPSAENQAQNVTAPDALVKDLYKQHDAQKSPFFQTKNRALVDKYFDKNLGDMIWKDAKESQDEVAALGFDPVYYGQDMEIKNFAVGESKINGEKAEVIVTFENFKEKQKLIYSLIKQNGEWKISDINYGEETLTKVFKDYYQDSPNTKSLAGEFEGKYQVGDTTCTVTPTKMSFDVRWAKGSGTEHFFYKESDNGKQVFESDEEDGKANSFEFDDENYNAGTFYRADGKTLPVKRIK